MLQLTAKKNSTVNLRADKLYQCSVMLVLVLLVFLPGDTSEVSVINSQQFSAAQGRAVITTVLQKPAAAKWAFKSKYSFQCSFSALVW